MKLKLQANKPRPPGLYLKVNWMHGDADFYENKEYEIGVRDDATPAEVLSRAQQVNALLKPLRGKNNPAFEADSLYVALNGLSVNDPSESEDCLLEFWPRDKYYGDDARAQVDEFKIEYVDPQTGLVFDVIED